MIDNNKQEPLFIETINEALREAVKALGGAKEVGKKLRPEKMADEAGRWLLDCLNPERRERLDPDQVMWILREARKVGCHVAMNFICDDAGYSKPLPLEPEDEKAQLQREFIESTKALARMAQRIEQLSNGGNSLKAVA
jgi:hypothetical protein